jgi:guanylate kinase
MRTAERELEAQPEFEHVVVNDRLEQATDELRRIVTTALAEGPGATELRPGGEAGGDR